MRSATWSASALQAASSSGLTRLAARTGIAINASITQTVTGFVVGTTYQLDFDYNARMDGNCCGTAGGHIPNFTVSLSDTDGSRMWSYNDSAATAVDANGSYVNTWYHGRITFRPDQDTLVLVVASDTMGADGTALIDNIKLTVFTP